MIWRYWKKRPEAPPPATDHPYLQGRYAFERLFGDLAHSRRQWQATALVAIVSSVVLATGFVLLTRTHTAVPYVVEVDALGEVRAVTELKTAEPPERALQVALRRFVHNLRTVPSDLRLLNVQLAQAQAFVAGRAKTTFTHEVRDRSADLEQMLRRGETRYVENIPTLLKVPGETNVYRLAWREIHNEQTHHAYEGHFKIRVMAPESANALLDNPLGIFVTDYTWSKTSE